MAEPESAGTERVNAFLYEDRFYVRHHFEGEAVFAPLRRYYNSRQYRFEIPREEFRDVRTTLANHGYELRVRRDLERFAVAVRKYTAHPENVFADSVLQISAGDFNVFVMRDERAVEAAVSEEGRRLSEAPVSVSFPTGPGVGPAVARDLQSPSVR